MIILYYLEVVFLSRIFQKYSVTNNIIVLFIWFLDFPVAFIWTIELHALIMLALAINRSTVLYYSIKSVQNE